MELDLILNTTKTDVPNIDILYTLNISQTHLTILRNALPQNYNYIIDSFEAAQLYNFLGAQEEPFKLKFHINTCTIDSTKAWFNDHDLNTETVDNQKVISTRTRDTNCTATLSLQLQNKYDTHPCIVSMLFHHNHPLISGHVTGFHSVSNETKQAFYELFRVGHNPASVYHTYLEKMQLKYENDEEILADRAICPYKYDVYYLEKFLNISVGAKNGKEMFSRLAKKPYVAPMETDSGQPFILIILTNLIKCCHTLQQAEELIFMDTTASLDVLNT
ncbi:22950_t:CDS:2 [Cetraspora pellucida]|uniref:22950_t:CDS:1 n=1 Tax=Cetraspora pellucida TaxID=1433469 RepID=A0A9N9AXY6_9GLOM|nr:22950_t:CDS:2 [Cetraspora pellucida]